MGALRFKLGATLHPSVLDVGSCARVLIEAFRTVAGPASDLLVTCGADSHPTIDPHTLGRAFDLRTRELPDVGKADLLDAVLHALEPGIPHVLSLPGIWLAKSTPHWFAQIEHHNEPGEHLHVQLRQGVSWPLG